MLELVKRPQQLLSIKADALISVVNNDITEYFIEVPKAKAQTGLAPDLWSISKPLAEEFNVFNNRPKIKQLQQKYNLDFPQYRRHFSMSDLLLFKLNGA